MPAMRHATNVLAAWIRAVTQRTKSPVLATAILLISTLAVAAVVQAAPEIRVVSEGARSPDGAHQFLLHSARVGRDFLVVVTPPPATSVLDGSLPDRQKSANQKYPAIYALDAGRGIAGPLAQMMARFQIMSPAYVVSIGYPAGQADVRNADLLHRAFIDNGQTYGGGGAIFQAFLTEDLRPFLDARYPLDPEKAILFGHSFGGLFTAEVLASSPQAFSGYIIGSPSVWADPQLLPDLAAAASKGKGQRVYLAAGEHETEDLGGTRTPSIVQGVDRIAAILGVPNSTFIVEKHIFTGATHISYYPVLVPTAFVWMLPPAGAGRVSVAVSPEDLEQIVGDYQLPDGRIVTIRRDGAKIFARVTGMPGETEVLAETSRRFFLPGGFDVLYIFEGSPDSKASSLLVRVNGAESRAMRKTTP
jgi:predicted alpha/beta superfamily hydrolase